MYSVYIWSPTYEQIEFLKLIFKQLFGSDVFKGKNEMNGDLVLQMDRRVLLNIHTDSM